MKAPAFQFYPADWLSSQRVQMMTLEEEGVYIRLLCYCWSHGSIPSDADQIERLLGKKVSTNVVTNVQRMFNFCSNDNSRMIHPRLEEEKGRQEARREQTSKAGKKSAETRKNPTKGQQKSNERSTDVATNVEETLQRKSNPSSSSSSSLEEEEKKGISAAPPAEGEAPISLDAVKKTCGQFGATEAMAEDWWLYYDARGWMAGSATMVKWQSSLARWANNARDKEGRDAPVKKPNPMGMKSKEDLAWEKEKREVDEFNAAQDRKNKEYGIRFMANAAWARENPETRGPKPFPKWEETDMYQEVEE